MTATAAALLVAVLALLVIGGGIALVIRVGIAEQRRIGGGR